jgi:hypothetical protein
MRGGTAALALSWSVCIVMLVAPALGRCDPGHIFINGLGAFLGAFVLLESLLTHRIFKNLFFIAFGTAFSIGLPILNLHIMSPNIIMQLQNTD